MAENQGTQTSEWQDNKEMNIKENSSETDSNQENDKTAESSWRPTDNEGELKDATKMPTGAAGDSPARQPDKAEGEDFAE
ncbi:hypothetical protein BH10ACI1_BH10ACI1_28390 [soil metagenome]